VDSSTHPFLVKTGHGFQPKVFHMLAKVQAGASRADSISERLAMLLPAEV